MKVNQDYHHRAKELDRGFGGDSSDGFDAELSIYGKDSRVLGLVVGAYGETSDDVYTGPGQRDSKCLDGDLPCILPSPDPPRGTGDLA